MPRSKSNQTAASDQVAPTTKVSTPVAAGDRQESKPASSINNHKNVKVYADQAPEPVSETSINGVNKVAMPEKAAPAKAHDSGSEHPDHHRKTNLKNKRSSPTKAELEVMLNEIQTALDLATTNHHQKEQQLLTQINDLQTKLEAQPQIAADRQAQIEAQQDQQEQIESLQSQLQEYKDYVEKIKTYLEQATKLKDELDHVKQENTQLLEANQKLTAELATSQPNPAPHRSAPRSSSIVVRRSLSTKKFNPADRANQNQPKATPKSQHSLKREILNRPVMPARTAQKINDANIGWVD